MRIERGCPSVVALVIALGVATGGEKRVKPFFDETEGSFNNCLCISRDGKKLALNHWTIWEIPTGKKVLSGKTRCCQTIAFSPDGNLLSIAGNYSEFFVYDARTGKVVWDLTLVGHGDTVVNQVEFTPDGRHLVSSSDNGMLRVWDLHTQKAQALFCFTSKYKLYNGWKDYLRAWRALAGNKPPDGVQTFVVFEEPIYDVSQFSISPDGKSIALALRTSEVWLLELATGRVLKTFRTDQVRNISVRFSGDGKLLAVGGTDDEPDTKKCTIEVWDVAAVKRLVTCPGHRHSVLHLAISPDNKTIVSGGLKDGVRVWDMATGKEKFALHQEKEIEIAGLAVLSDSKTLLTLPCGLEQPVHFWDLGTGKPVSPIQEKPPK